MIPLIYGCVYHCLNCGCDILILEFILSTHHRNIPQNVFCESGVKPRFLRIFPRLDVPQDGRACFEMVVCLISALRQLRLETVLFSS